MKGLAAALFFLASVIASAASITIESAYPSDVSGNPVQVALGDSFYMRANLHVDAPLNGTYRVRFDLPYLHRTSPDVGFSGEAYVVWGPYPALLAGPMPVKVTVQSASDAAGPPLTIQILPTEPSQGIEYFNPQDLSGWVGASANLSAGTPAGLQWYAPIPEIDGFQQGVQTQPLGSVVVSKPFLQPVLSITKAGDVSVEFQAVSSSSRVNASLLRSVGFTAFKTLPPDVQRWLQPETLIESQSTPISLFVARALPRNFKAALPPYDVAQRIFQAVVGCMQYAETTARPDAIVALRTGRGDCGWFSALFVACCRNAGIPARTVAGITLGNNAWHVWAEFYLPGFGWIPADPAYSNGLCPDGSLPVYFGTIPELNQRAAVSYGFDHGVNGHAIPMLQSPMVFASGSTRIRSVRTSCGLAVVAVDR
ncbi:MAG: transglutaminase-like domain-containing protein [Fimbriimonadales bacterium]